MLKFFIFSLIVLTGVNSFAGYHCRTEKGDEVIIFSHILKGMGAVVKSQAVTDYYKQNLNIEVVRLKSIIDPETKEFATEDLGKGQEYKYLFALSQEDVEGGNMWSLEFKLKPGFKANGSLVDTSGVEFSLNLSCEQTGDLE